MSNHFDAFCSKYGDSAGQEVLERITDAGCGVHGEGVVISDVYRHNACNHTYTGHIEYAGETFHFIIHSGDWNGTDVEEFGTIDEVGVYDPPKPTLYTFVPRNPLLKFEKPAMWDVYLHWRKQEWFQDKVRGYNYDRHFAPGLKTERYYQEFAQSKGLVIASTEEFERMMNRTEAPLKTGLADIVE